MRFSIRELLWLMTIVALVATLFADRQRMQRQQAKWVEEKNRIEETASARVAAAHKQLAPLRHDNAILQHQVFVGLEKQVDLERKLDLAVQLRDRTSPPSQFRPVIAPADAASAAIDSSR